MKILILFFTIVITGFVFSRINAQSIPRQTQIITGEYFIGSDPGVGKGTNISFSNQSTAVTATISNLNLKANQTLFIRFKNANNFWSSPSAVTFTGLGVSRLPAIIYAEYFIGNDPGKGNGTVIPISSNSQVKLNLPSINLLSGQSIHLRVKDEQERWSYPVALKYPQRYIRAAEVIVSNNPNNVLFGHGIPMQTINGKFGESIVNVESDNLNWNSADTIWVRVQSSDYLWSDLIGTKTITDIQKNPKIPKEFSLSQNYPNPFNPTTKIDYSIPKTSFVTIKVYDVLGREVATLMNEEKKAGNYSTQFVNRQLASGVYFYKLSSGDFSEVRKLMVLK